MNNFKRGGKLMRCIKKALLFILPLALCAVSMVYAMPESNTRPAPVSYDQLSQLVIAGNPVYQKELQQIRKVEIAIDEMRSALDELNRDINVNLQPIIALLAQLNIKWAVDVQTAIALRSGLVAAEDLSVKLRSELDSKAAQLIYPAQKMYVAHYTLTPETEIALRDLEALEKDLTICRQKLSRGMVTSDAVQNAERSVANQKDAVKAARKKADDNLEALAKYLDLDGVELMGLPAIDLARITGRDPAADQAAYRLSASAAEERAMKAAGDTYDKSGSSADRYAYTIASEDYEKAKNQAEKAFPKVYEALRDAYDDFIGSTMAVDAQKKYDNAQSQLDRGLIAPNTLLSVERALLNAKDRKEQQRIHLWMLMLEYEYDLISF